MIESVDTNGLMDAFVSNAPCHFQLQEWLIDACDRESQFICDVEHAALIPALGDPSSKDRPLRQVNLCLPRSIRPSRLKRASQAGKSAGGRTRKSVPNWGHDRLQKQGLVRMQLADAKLDGTLMRGHPDGRGARIELVSRLSAAPSAAGPPRCIWLPRTNGLRQPAAWSQSWTALVKGTEAADSAGDATEQ